MDVRPVRSHGQPGDVAATLQPGGEGRDDPRPWVAADVSVERIEGPTRKGGACADLMRADGEVVEIIEYDADSRELARTYGSTGPPHPGRSSNIPSRYGC